MVRDATLTANTAVDVTPPSITLTAPSVDEIVELGSSEMAVYLCADDALATCVGDVANGDPIDTSGVGPHSLTVNATDTSGNAATLTHTYTVVDSTNPTISLSTPSAGATYDLGQSVNAAYSCSDLALSTCLGGVAAGTAIDTSAPGPHSFTVNAVDTSTNHASATSSYSVTNNIASSLLPAGSPPMTITNVPSGYTVSVTDANDPADGVTVAVSGIGAAKVTMSVCGGFTVRIAPGSIVTLTCASIKAKVLQGSVQLETPDATVTLSLVSGGQAELKGSGDVVVAAGSTPATVTAGGVSQTLPPGSSAAWRASGFYQPVDMNGVWNTMKGGVNRPGQVRALLRHCRAHESQRRDHRCHPSQLSRSQRPHRHDRGTDDRTRRPSVRHRGRQLPPQLEEPQAARNLLEDHGHRRQRQPRRLLQTQLSAANNETTPRGDGLRSPCN